MDEQRRNSFEEQDFRDVVAEIEAFEDSIKSIMASAMGKAGGIRKQIKNKKKIAKDELGIPSAILNASLKTRKLERKIQEIADDIPEELTELWVEASGQYSWLAPAADEEPGPEPAATPATKAARRRKKAADENEAREQEDGAKVLEELGAGLH